MVKTQRGTWRAGPHRGKMSIRRKEQRARTPTWQLILLSAFGDPIPNEKQLHWRERQWKFKR